MAPRQPRASTPPPPAQPPTPMATPMATAPPRPAMRKSPSPDLEREGGGAATPQRCRCRPTPPGFPSPSLPPLDLTCREHAMSTPDSTPAPPPAATSAAATPGFRWMATGRLGAGELRRQVAAHLAAHPGRHFTPGEI